MNKPYFITVEGIEGTGKSTAIEFLKKHLEAKPIDYIATREPGGTQVAENIRQILLHEAHEKIHCDTELLLMFASRVQHIQNLIKPALSKGQWVLCDRFTDASYAYQGGGRGIEASRIEAIERFVQNDFGPDITLLLDAPVEIALSRIQGREKDRIEKENPGFFSRARDVYLSRAKQYPKRFRIIDAACDLDSVERQLKTLLDTL